MLYHAGRILANYAYLSTVKLAEVAPDSLWLHLAAGEANESQGRWEAALQEYKAVLSLQPNVWLDAVGVPNELIIVKDAPHFGAMYDVDELRNQVIGFLKKQLGAETK